ncbi:hypothetical protein ACFQO7_26895 [Catellatospora aurea]|uniref:Antitoxin YefM n=1 Tax=Catellatospora aurea TaxID=1337874 RepID=A0ABW2H1S5_9ACTN
MRDGHMPTKANSGSRAPGADEVVVASLDDDQPVNEAAHMLRSPENARRLLSAIDRLESGSGAVPGLTD